MADTKITALSAITTVDPANDVLPIVDVSDTSMAASGTTKKITTNQILGASGTATLASATITGDLTVDTNTLKVDSANNRVGIGTASPAAGYALDVRGVLAAGNGTIIGGVSYSSRPEIGAISNHNLGLIANNTTMHLITPAGVFDWYDGAGGTRMTLNSNGLGIGVTPSAWPAASKAIDVDSYGANYAIAAATQVGISRNCYYNGTNWIYKLTTSAQRFEQDNGGGFKWFTAAAGTASTAITFTQAMTLDASGRLIINSSTFVTPTLNTNGELNFMATSNTNLRFSYRGTDGVTRTADITLA